MIKTATDIISKSNYKLESISEKILENSLE